MRLDDLDKHFEEFEKNLEVYVRDEAGFLYDFQVYEGEKRDTLILEPLWDTKMNEDDE